MTEQGGALPRPVLLRGSRGTLQCVYYAPPGPGSSGDILFVPAFAEEMNRCRAMVAMQARALAGIGVGTLIVDPYGTGDSEGDFVDGTWGQWKEDLRRGIDWLRDNGNGCRALWGVRLGALMAAELAVEGRTIDRLLLWQPVLSGKSFFTQFLRIRIAAEMGRPGGAKSTEALRALLGAGEAVEVSGYRIGPALAAEIDRIAMPEPEMLARLKISWFEVLPTAEAGLPRASSKMAADLAAAGVGVDLKPIVGPPFWQVHERELAPDLITETTSAVADWSPVPMSGPARHVESQPPGSTATERPLVFACDDDALMGVIHRATPGSRRGVVIVVAGGPQYRAGAHRQFVSMARKLARHGHAVLRFDLRGMGDSSGTYAGFEQSDADLRAAVNALLAGEPGVEEVVLIGECESASGILFYAWRDPRVAGIVLINPWVRTDEGQAQVIVKHYYLDRLRSPEFWTKVREGRFDLARSFRSLVDVLRSYARGRRSMSRRALAAGDQADLSSLPLPARTAEGLRRFPGRVLVLMSGRDYIAREFDEVTASSRAWDGLLDQPRVTRMDLAEADHTFSREEWKGQASDWIVDWIGR